MFPNVMAVIIGIITGTAVYMGYFGLLLVIPGIFGASYLSQAIFLLMALGGWVVVPLASSFCGSWVAIRRGSAHPMLLAMIVGSALTGVTLLVMYLLFREARNPNHPEGIQDGADVFPLLLNLFGAMIAGGIPQKRRAAGDTSAPAPAEAGKAESDET